MPHFEPVGISPMALDDVYLLCNLIPRVWSHAFRARDALFSPEQQFVTAQQGNTSADRGSL